MVCINHYNFRGEFTLKINNERLKQHFDVIKAISSTELGQTRFSYSNEDSRTREYLTKVLEEIGMTPEVDCVGNIRAKYNPKNLKTPSIMTGSHIDTVKNGGLFDGLLGVLASIETIQTIKENSVELFHPIELVIFAEEEGSNFNVTMLGSKIMTGKLTIDDLHHLKNDKGQSAYELIGNAGYLKNPCRVLEKGEVKAFIEYHIEQGGILESRGKSLGIVQAIAGMKTKEVNIKGVSNHAGTTPMNLRSDPMVAASQIILNLSKVPNLKKLETAVVTVGKLATLPNASNVIPEKVTFTVDIRDVTEEGIKTIENELQEIVKSVSEEYGVNGAVSELGSSEIIRLSSNVVNVIERCATDKHFDFIMMNSGAVHDCAMLSKQTDIGMIFVPSKGGISHSPFEHTDYEDINNGANLLLDSILALAT